MSALDKRFRRYEYSVLVVAALVQVDVDGYYSAVSSMERCIARSKAACAAIGSPRLEPAKAPSRARKKSSAASPGCGCPPEQVLDDRAVPLPVCRHDLPNRMGGIGELRGCVDERATMETLTPDLV